MIKILNAFETSPHDEYPPKLHVDLEINGYPWVVSGLPVEWKLNDLKKFLKENYQDILRQAKLKPPKPKKYPCPRPEFVTEFEENL